MLFFIISLLCISFSFCWVLLLLFGAFLLCAPIVFFRLFATCFLRLLVVSSCCSYVPPCYALLVFINTSWLCVLVALQCFLIMCSCCSSIFPYCVVHACCLLTPRCCVFLLFINTSLLCAIGAHQCLLIVLCILVVCCASLLCVFDVRQHCFVVLLLFMGTFLLCSLVAYWHLLVVCFNQNTKYLFNPLLLFVNFLLCSFVVLQCLLVVHFWWSLILFILVFPFCIFLWRCGRKKKTFFSTPSFKVYL